MGKQREFCLRLTQLLHPEYHGEKFTEVGLKVEQQG